MKLIAIEAVAASPRTFAAIFRELSGTERVFHLVVAQQPVYGFRAPDLFWSWLDGYETPVGRNFVAYLNQKLQEKNAAAEEYNKQYSKLLDTVGGEKSPLSEAVIEGIVPPSTGTAFSRITTDPSDPRLLRGVDEEKTSQAPAYLVLSENERAKGFVRPVRVTYRHLNCGTTTTMGQVIAETYARNPSFYGSTFCCHCSRHRPLTEFCWLDGQEVGS